jgi:hypothetical protein
MKTKTMLLMAVILAAAPATAAVTPISGMVGTKAWARIGSGPSQTEQYGPDSSSSWTTLQPGTIFAADSSSTLSFDGGLVGNNASSSAYRSIKAGWSSATAGRVRADWGWAFDGAVMQKAAGPQKEFTPNWAYAFTLTTPAELTVNAVRQSSASNGSIIGLNTLFMYLTDAGPLLFLDQDMEQPFSSLKQTVMLAPGDYQFSLKGNSGVSGIIGDYSADASMDISWDIKPIAGGVPEPENWTMLIAGFGLTGTAMRRRSRMSRPHNVTA